MKTYVLQPPSGPPGGYRIDYEEELNPAQLQVVMAGGGPLLVIAGAGSGKTRTLTYRVARLLESGVRADAILLVTFTNKAAREMLRRVEGLLESCAPRIWGGTFHHIGHLVLRRHARAVGLAENFTILDREDSGDLMGDALDDLKLAKGEGGRFPKPNVLVEIASFAANTLRTIEDVVGERHAYHLDRLPEIERVIGYYVARKRSLQLVDFDDLLVFWRQLLREPGEAAEFYARRFEHILVDEYQDTNRLQGELVDLLARGRRNLTVVGDDAQSIYAFRGAHFENIITFPERYPDAVTFRLETNYRSTPQVLALANSSIAHNRRQFPKVLQPVRPAGELPALVSTDDARQQAEFVAQRTAELLESGVPPHEIAVLYRAHFHALELQMELARRQVPFVVRSGLKFFEQAHVKDLVAYAKVVANPHDGLAWRRVICLYPAMGKKTAARLWHHLETAADPMAEALGEGTRAVVPKAASASWKRLTAVLRDLAEPSLRADPSRLLDLALEAEYDDYLKDTFPNATARREELDQLITFARQYDSLESFLADIALQSEVVAEPGPAAAPEEGNVILTTIHQAKGLEWKAVFVIGLAQGQFPDNRSLADPRSVEEERRLFYVAVTRAKDLLYLCYPLVSGRSEWDVMQRPSEFLGELAPGTYEEWRLTRKDPWGGGDAGGEEE